MAYCALCNKQIGFFTAEFLCEHDFKAPSYEGCSDCAKLTKALSVAAQKNDAVAFKKAENKIREISKNQEAAHEIITYYGRRVDGIKDDIENKERAEAEQKAAEQKQLFTEQMAYMQKLRDIPVTTTDLKEPYEVLGPVFFNTTNKGVFSSAFTKLCEKYTKEPYSVLVKRPGGESIQTGEFGSFLLSLFDLGGGYEGSVGQWQFDDAYYYSIAELKLRCAEMGGDAIVGMSMDFDLDTNNAAAFYLQMHGTAVKLK